MRRAAHLGVAQSHVDAALNLLVWMAPADDIKAFLPQMAALTAEHFASDDPRRIRVAKIAHDLQQPNARAIDPSERAFLAETVRRHCLCGRSPVVLALLKLPTGALTAPLGLLLMRGGFVPGLSALDSPAQIIA